MEAIHAVLMLDKEQANIFMRFYLTGSSGLRVCVYLRQAGEDGGAAGRAAAHRGEGVLKYQAALSQRAKVRGADH